MRPAQKNKKQTYCSLIARVVVCMSNSTRQFSRRSSFDPAESTGAPNGSPSAVLRCFRRNRMKITTRTGTLKLSMRIFLGPDKICFFGDPACVGRFVGWRRRSHFIRVTCFQWFWLVGWGCRYLLPKLQAPACGVYGFPCYDTHIISSTLFI